MAPLLALSVTSQLCCLKTWHLESFCRRRLQGVASKRQLNCHAADITVDLSEDLGKPTGLTLPPGIELLQQRLEFCGHCFNLVVPTDVDAVMDMYIQADQMDRDPYWARPWPSAIALAAHLLQNPHLVAGKSVADLGCGLGLGGIAAALAGAREVLLLDRERLALQCALLSARASGLGGVDISGWHLEEVCHRLLHGQDENATETISRHAAAASAPVCSLRGELFDWTQRWTQPKVDVVLACDVLYEDFSVEPIAELVPQMLFSTGARLILADPANRTRQNRAKFAQLMAQQSPPLLMSEPQAATLASAAATLASAPGSQTQLQILEFEPTWERDLVAQQVMLANYLK